MLTAPLVFSVLAAGMVGGVHCVGMCGGISTLLVGNKKILQPVIPIVVQAHKFPVIWRAHIGRLCTYSVIGALAGTAGGVKLLLKPYFPIHEIIFVIGNLAIMLLGLRLLGCSPRINILKIFKGVDFWVRKKINFSFLIRMRTHLFLSGLIWGWIPCGLIYSASLFSWLSGDPLSGAFLMFLFWLGSLPYLIFVQGAAGSLSIKTGRISFLFRKLTSIILLGTGMYGLLHVNNTMNIPTIFCVVGS